MARKSGEATRGKKVDVTVQTLIDMFILSKQVEGKSTRTIGWYRANLDSFAKFATNGEPPRLGDLTLESGRAFIAHLQGKTTRYGGHHMRPVQQGGLSQVLNQLGKVADVPRLHAHLPRHTFAVHYLMNGGDLMTLKLLLGHTTIDVTQMYLHLAESHVQVQHSRFSPVDRLEAATRRSRKH